MEGQGSDGPVQKEPEKKKVFIEAKDKAPFEVKNPAIAEVLTKNPWAVKLLSEYRGAYDKGFDSSYEVGLIVEGSVEALQDIGYSFEGEERDTLLLGALLHDVGKTDHPDVYTNPKNVRNDPLDPLRESIRLHPTASYNKIAAFNEKVAQIAARHHTFKKEDAYPDQSTLPPADQKTVLSAKVVSLVDYAQAILGDQEQRLYMNKEEILEAGMVTHHETPEERDQRITTGVVAMVHKDLEIGADDKLVPIIVGKTYDMMKRLAQEKIVKPTQP